MKNVNQDYKFFIKHFWFIAYVVLFSACVKTYKIFKDESPQGVAHKIDQTAINENLRSVRVYKEWQTVALFDALLISKDLLSLYVDVYSKKRGWDEDTTNAMLRQEIEKNKDWISLYILADVRVPEREQLNDPDPVWSMYLETVEGKTILPVEIKLIEELQPEIRSFFVDKVNVYKISYLVKFPSVDLQDKWYAGEKIPLKLVISSVDRECNLFWGDHPEMYDKKRKKINRVKVTKKLAEKQKSEKYEDFYWL